MSVSLTTVALAYGTTASMSALRGVGQHPAGVSTPTSGAFALSSFLNQYPTIQPSAGVVTTLAGGSTSGYVDATGSSAKFWNLSGVAVDSSGNVYVGDSSNNVIRKITPLGVVTTFATGFNFPYHVAVDSSGNVYVADSANHLIRKITPLGVVSTLAGSTSGYADGTGSSAKFSSPDGVAVDSSGNVYVGDTGNNVIRKITPLGAVTTFATGFNHPNGVAVDSSGNVYVADTSNYLIRKITPLGVVSTLAGSTRGYVDATGSSAKFYTPYAVAVDSSGNVYVGDTGIDVIRKITPLGVVSTLAGSTSGYADGTGSSAKFYTPIGITIDSSGNLYVADRNNATVRKIT